MNIDILPSTLRSTGTAKVADALLSVENLVVEFNSSRGRLRAVDGISYSVAPGEILAIVGESGCGKSVSSLAIMRLLPRGSARATGRIMFQGRDLLRLGDDDMRRIRGRDIAMIFQEPMSSLNPVLSIGEQIKEPLFIHLAMSAAEADARARELLGLVGITDPERRLTQYPHELSGGMRQRVMIAIGLACNPKLIIADEPTTALDVTIQAQILELLRDLAQRLDIAVILITHNLGIVARYADRVNVMYAARIVETGAADAIFHAPRHPYTIGLMRSVPRLDRPRAARLATIEGLPPDLCTPPSTCRFAPRCFMRIAVCDVDPPLVEIEPGHRSACHRAADVPAAAAASEAPAAAGHAQRSFDGAPIVSVENIKRYFTVGGTFGGKRGTVCAVDDVSFAVAPGETLGIVGESGCGKSTLGRLILRLDTPTAGRIVVAGRDVTTASAGELKAMRRKMQVIFQDPFSSLNPRMTIAKILAEPLVSHRITPGAAATAARIDELLAQVGLPGYMAERYPHEMSGGQRQRVGIARALALDPTIIVCDEPVSALDVSIQGQIINLLEDLKRRLGLTYLFIAHDLAVVRHISDRLMVMYLGRLMEFADRDDLYAEPLHPYTRALLDAAPVPDPTVERARAPRALQGELPSPLRPPPGCVFNTRCPLADEECRAAVPAPREIRKKHIVACHKV